MNQNLTCRHHQPVFARNAMPQIDNRPRLSPLSNSCYRFHEIGRAMSKLRSVRCYWFSGILIMVAGITGCGSDNFPTAPASGTVICQGKPVSGGMVYFSPIGTGGKSAVTGKPASGSVGDDGKFVLTTYQDGDGAVIGQHHVIYSPPLSDGPAPKFPCAGSVPADQTVKAGKNEFTVDLSGM